MTGLGLSRRGFILASLASYCLVAPGRAEETTDLVWEDLLPKDAKPSLRGVVRHDQASLASQQPQSTGVRIEWNGKTVRIPGFIVPIKQSGSGVVTFILVPFVGACIHVPPPPANQLVLVTTETPYEVRDLFAPVRVTGVIEAASTATELAEIGYAITASNIEAYES